MSAAQEMSGHDLVAFVTESNAIEGISREPTRKEIRAHGEFLALTRPKVRHLDRFVQQIGGGLLRDKPGMDVRVGSYRPMPGGPDVREKLVRFLGEIEICESPWGAHVDYEQLHPFMDGNGRSGRVLWLWMMEEAGLRIAPLGFLQTFYYQTLDGKR